MSGRHTPWAFLPAPLQGAWRIALARGICRGLVRTPSLKKPGGTSPLATTLSLLLDGHPLPTWPVGDCRALCCLLCPQVSCGVSVPGAGCRASCPG